MRWIALLLISLIPLITARAEDWPQWLGPNRNGTSKEIVKPWKGEPNVQWRTEVGEGHSSPIVAKGLVYLHDKVPGKNEERLTAWVADGGKPVGAVIIGRGPFSSLFGAGPRATPIFFDNLVFTYGVTGLLSSQTLLADTSGKARINSGFSIDTLQEFKASNLKFGVAASPLVEHDLVIVLVGGKGAGVVAFDPKKGEVAWKALDDPASYTSPIAIGEGDKRQVIVLTQLGLASLSPKDGQVYWKYPFRDLLSESSTTPVKVGDLLIASSVTLGSVALKLIDKDGKPAAEEVWKKPELSCYFSTPVAVGSYLYMVNGSILPKPTILLRCVETATGKTLWSKSNIGRYHAALLRTGDDKLLMLDDNGHLTLIQPDPAGYKELARSKICGETWAHPALVNGRLFVRDNKELICLQLGE